MKLGSRFTAFLGLILLVAAMPVFAQMTASLTGTVTTEGNPLPGVTVTISSPALQGTRTDTTGDGGGYSFAALPPGTYKVRFELSGMAPVERTVAVNLSTQATANADLKVSAVSEAITVTAAAPTVLESPQIAATMSAEQVEELPIPRTFEGAALLAPGVNGNTFSANQFQISGSPGYDNLVMVNGVPVTESVRAQFLNLFIEDAIQETTVLTGAISAEYGRFTGGVVNSITKSGGNEFSGSLRDSISNASWTEKTPFANQADPIDKNNFVYEGTLGGYVMRDRLWFFAAGRKAETSNQAQTLAITSTSNPLRNKPALFYSTGFDEDRYEIKLTGQITPKHNLVGSYIDVDRVDINNRFTANIYDLESLETRNRPDTLGTVSYNGVLTSNLLVEAQWSHRTMEFVNSGSKFTDIQKGTLLLDLSDSRNPRFNSPTFCGVCDTESRNNDGLLLKANYFLSTKSFGNHNFVIGGEDFSEHRYAANHQSGSDYRIFVSNVWFNPAGAIFPNFENVTARPTVIRWTPIFDAANESDLNIKSVFINDKWDLNNHFSFNVGFRYDKNDTVDGSGTKVSDDQAFSPRLTAMYDPTGNGRHRFSLSYNNYVSRVVEGIAGSNSTAGQPAAIDFLYTGPAINPASNPFQLPMHQAIQAVFDWFNAQCNAAGQCGPNNNSLLQPGGAKSVPGFSAVIDDTLKSPSVDEFAVGYATQFGSSAYAKVDYIHRDWKDFYANSVTQSGPDATTPLGIPVDVTVVKNTNDIERTYRAVQFQGGWRPRRWNLGLNYTWAKLRGNDEGENAGSGPIANTPLSEFYPELQGYANRLPIGPLNGDQRHRLRMWAGYDLPLPEVIGSVNVSVLQQYNSGVAWSESFAINARTYPGAATGLNYVGGTPATATYYLCRGCNRMDDETRTDLAVNYAKRLWKVEFFAQGELLNVFNEDAVINSTAISTTISRTSTAFNPFTTTPVEGTHYTINRDTFGKPTSFNAYQLARTYQFSLGLRF